MVHPQMATPIQTDNYTSYGIVNNKAHKKLTKAMGVSFYLAQDRIIRSITASFQNLSLLIWQIISSNIIRLIIISKFTQCISTVRRM